MRRGRCRRSCPRRPVSRYNPRPVRTKSLLVFTAVVAAFVAAAVVVVRHRRPSSQPIQIDQATYDSVSRQFFRGLAQLEVGLIDDSVKAFDAATKTVPDEPASWANLGLAHLRLGDFDSTATALDRAGTLAPSNSAIAFLRGRF